MHFAKNKLIGIFRFILLFFLKYFWNSVLVCFVAVDLYPTSKVFICCRNVHLYCTYIIKSLMSISNQRNYQTSEAEQRESSDHRIRILLLWVTGIYLFGDLVFFLTLHFALNSLSAFLITFIYLFIKFVYVSNY